MRSVVRRVARAFMQGLVALLPLLVTVWLVATGVRLVERLVDDLLFVLPPSLQGIPWVVVATEVVVVLLVVGAIAVLGMLVRTVLGRAAMAWVDRFVTSIPLLAPVYRATRQVADVVAGPRDRFFTRPVLVEYPSDGIWAVAFHTGAVDPSLAPDAGTDLVTVFIPTTPNPTSGFLAFVPASRVRPLRLSVEDAMKLVLTGGVVKGRTLPPAPVSEPPALDRPAT